MQISETSARLSRASKLTTGLSDEQTRWAATQARLEKDLPHVLPIAFLSAASVAYLGPFTRAYRQSLLSDWITKCKDCGLPVPDNFSMITSLADPVQVRDWNIWGLPTDPHSIENGILVTNASGKRWPLIMDPQGQANKWIKEMEYKNGLKVIKMTDNNFMRTLENNIRIGTPVLLEDVGETLDPALDPILQKATFRQGGRLILRIGDIDVDYDRNFR